MEPEAKSGNKSPLRESADFELLTSRGALFVEEINEDQDPYAPIVIPSGETVILAANQAMQEILEIKEQLRRIKDSAKDLRSNQSMTKGSPIATPELERKEDMCSSLVESLQIERDAPKGQQKEQKGLLPEPVEQQPKAGEKSQQAEPMNRPSEISETDVKNEQHTSATDFSQPPKEAEKEEIPIMAEQKNEERAHQKAFVDGVGGASTTITKEEPVEPSGRSRELNDQTSKTEQKIHALQPAKSELGTLLRQQHRIDDPEGIQLQVGSSEGLAQRAHQALLLKQQKKEQILRNEALIKELEKAEKLQSEQYNKQQAERQIQNQLETKRLQEQRQKKQAEIKQMEKKQRLQREAAQQARIRRLDELRRIADILTGIKRTATRDKKKALEMVEKELPASYQQQMSVVHIKAKLLSDLGQISESLRLYGQLAQHPQAGIEVHFEKACLEFSKGDLQAAKLTAKALKNPESSKHHILLGDLAYKQSPMSEAAERFYSKAHYLEQTAVSASRLAAIHINRRNYKEALGFLELAIKKDNFCGQYLNDKAFVEMELQKYNDADASLTSAISCERKMPWQFANNQTICKMMLGKGQEYYQQLGRAVNESSLDRRAVMNYARATEILGGESKALSIYERFMPQFKADLGYWLRYCTTTLRTSNKQLATKVFSEFYHVYNLNLKDRSAQLMFCKLQAFCNSDSNYNYCRERLKKLLDGAQSPRLRADLHNTLALMHINKQLFNESSAALRLAFNQLPDNPTLRYNLAYSQYKSKNYQNALSTLELLHRSHDIPEALLKKIAYLTVMVHVCSKQKDAARSYIAKLMRERALTDQAFFTNLESRIPGPSRK